MPRHETSLPSSYFEDLYAADADPWRFATSAYEREKYAATLAALPHARYRSALEVGCSIGVLTRQLAARCVGLLALDASTTALAQACERCADSAHITFAKSIVPGDWPAGSFDLILLSEVVYYLDRQDVIALVAKVGASADDGADIILVHWLGETNYPLDGDEAADLFIETAAPFGRLHHQSRTEDYRLDVLRVCKTAR